MADLRGSGAQEAALRIGRVFNFMTAAEAGRCGIEEEERRRYIRIDGGKGGPGPLAKSSWLKIEAENIANGDVVAVAASWSPPGPFDDVTTAQMHECRKAVEEGTFRADTQSPDWVGYPISKVLDIDINHADRNHNKQGRHKVTQIIRTWLDNGVLAIEEGEDKHRKNRRFVVPGNWRRDGSCFQPL
jgi:hypothetical protein